MSTFFPLNSSLWITLFFNFSLTLSLSFSLSLSLSIYIYILQQYMVVTISLGGFVWFGLFSLFNGISTLFRLFNAKAILLEEQYYLTHSWDDKGVHTFPKGICPKVNVIARLEYELTYYDSAIHRFNHYTTRTPRWWVCDRPKAV